jgi:alanine dehydrogenase
MGHDVDARDRIWVDKPDGTIPVGSFLADNDLVVNCVLQDPTGPLVFVTENDLASFTPGSLIVDVSCDTGMGFSWARPTSFTQPVIELANGVHYYAVDHSPSYLWNSATWEISEALLPHLDTVLSGPPAWTSTPTISRAIEIRDGAVLNPDILSFQQREDAYPHVGTPRVSRDAT